METGDHQLAPAPKRRRDRQAHPRLRYRRPRGGEAGGLVRGSAKSGRGKEWKSGRPRSFFHSSTLPLFHSRRIIVARKVLPAERPLPDSHPGGVSDERGEWADRAAVGGGGGRSESTRGGVQAGSGGRGAVRGRFDGDRGAGRLGADLHGGDARGGYERGHRSDQAGGVWRASVVDLG